MTTSTLRDKLNAQGYVVVPDLIPSHLLEPLEEACRRTISKTRRGDWPYRRLVGKQFPPFEGDETDCWGVQHLMHPDLNEPVFAQWYGSEVVRRACAELLGCGLNDLQMELFNLLINPIKKPFALRWHRDDIPPTVEGAEELEGLARSYFGVQWNTALFKDSSLYLVPGSHVAALTQAQRALCTPDAPANPFDMPGAIRLTLKLGETVFYNNNVLHCAAYDNAVERITLHACMGDARGGNARARTILQHDLRWMRTEKMRSFLKVIDEGGSEGTARSLRVDMLQRLLKMAKETGGNDLGYSLQG